MHVIIRTISSFFPHQEILFLSKVMPLKICDTSPGLSNSITDHKNLNICPSLSTSVSKYVSRNLPQLFQHVISHLRPKSESKDDSYMVLTSNPDIVK